MSDEPELPEDLEARMLESLRTDDVPAPRKGLKDEILARAAGRVAGTSQAISTVLAAEGAWRELAPGIDFRILHDHGRMQTWLVRGAKGASFPEHDHAECEELLVLEGSVMVGDLLLRPGDYQMAPPGSRHGVIHCPEACVVLMRSSCPALV